jgi:endo-1,4-beta-xylanase
LKGDQPGTDILTSEFGMLADGNDLKMNRLRPDPQHFFFEDGDYALGFAKHHKMLLRGHTLVWHNALPDWFKAYVTKDNAMQVMTEHVRTTVEHYAGKLYSWDVVNEMIHTQEGRPDGLRPRPWLELIGPDYIEIALRTASDADPTVKLVINENTLEHDLPLHQLRRDALLGLCKNLKKKNAPLHAVGLQSHIKAGVPFATAALRDMLSQMRDLGLDVFITELDVDDTALPLANLDERIAQTYVEYLSLVGPYAKMICLEQLGDKGSFNDQQIEHRRADLQPHRPNLFDSSYKKKLAYYAVRQTIAGLPKL